METSILHLALLELMVWYGIMMVLPLGAAVKMREILTSFLPKTC
jgi:hypothetical protein